MKELAALVAYLRRYRRIYLLGLGCLLGSNLLALLGPRYLGQGIDAVSGPDPAAGVRRAAVLLVLTALVAGALRYGMRQLMNGASRRVEYDLRNDLFAHLLRLSASFFGRTPTGDVMARATNDLLAVRMVAGPALMYLVDTFTRACIMAPAMIAIDPALTGLALLPLLGLPLVMVVLGRRIHERSLAIQDHFGVLTNFVHENVSGVRVVRAYGQETKETGDFAQINTQYAELNLRLARAQGVFHPLLGFLGGLGAVIVLAVGGRLVLSGRITAGAFIAFGVYLTMLVWPMIALGWAVALIQRGSASMGRLNQLFRQKPEIADPPVPRELPPPRGGRAVRFEDVWFTYPGDAARGSVLRGISFEIPAGGQAAVVGATGSGKSALAELLVRVHDPDRGRITLDGVDIRELRLADLRREIGFVPQETFLFSETLRDNVLMGTADPERLLPAAEVSQLSAALADLPHGFDTMLGERGINLSGGQKQRAAIARALAKDPPVIVLDDALSAVDAETEAKILTRLRDALAGRTSLVISHREASVRSADLIVVLSGGEVVERGRHDELLAAGGRFAELVRRQRLEEEIEATT
ncbi:MAG TPA: ABC transporter ATP-binding protein, partial [Gemmatimonadales bacterium]